MPSPKFEHPVPDMTVEAASEYARYLVEHEARGLSDMDGALDRLEQRYGLSRWSVEHLRKGRAKSCDVGLFARLRMAYLDLCERQVSKLQHQIAIEKATNDDADLEDLVREAASLAAKIQARKAALKLRNATD